MSVQIIMILGPDVALELLHPSVLEVLVHLLVHMLGREGGWEIMMMMVRMAMMQICLYLMMSELSP